MGAHVIETPQNMSMSDAFAADPEAVTAAVNKGLGEFLGLQFTELSGDSVRAHWTIRPDMYQPMGLVHGGVYCAVVESLASMGAVAWLGGNGGAVGVNNSTDFLRAAREGTLFGHALPLHRGRLQQLWLVNIEDEDKRLVARGQVRLQNITDSARLGN